MQENILSILETGVKSSGFRGCGQNETLCCAVCSKFESEAEKKTDLFFSHQRVEPNIYFWDRS